MSDSHQGPQWDWTRNTPPTTTTTTAFPTPACFLVLTQCFLSQKCPCSPPDFGFRDSFFHLLPLHPPPTTDHWKSKKVRKNERRDGMTRLAKRIDRRRRGREREPSKTTRPTEEENVIHTLGKMQICFSTLPFVVEEALPSPLRPSILTLCYRERGGRRKKVFEICRKTKIAG